MFKLSTKKEYLTTTEASMLLKVCFNTICKYVKLGIIDVHHYVGNHRKFSRAELLKLKKN